MSAPIVVAPVADQKRFHPDGEAATVQGASLARAPIILSSHSSIPLASVVDISLGEHRQPSKVRSEDLE